MDISDDYYALLHVQADAPAAVIKASYRAMIQKLGHHPDKGGDVSFAQRLNNAVKVLCDPKTRAAYDALRKQQSSGKPAEPTKEKSRSEKSPSEKPPREKPSGDWGEPGGSPRAAEPEKRDNSTISKAQALPATPHCPFCRAPYATAPSAHPGVTDSYRSSSRCANCNGAKTPISQLPETSDAEIRRVYRHEHCGAARVWLTWPADADEQSTLADFSPAGCALLSGNPLPTGQVVMIETDLFNAICRVRHCRNQASRKADFSIGLEFVTLDMHASRGSLFNASA